MSELLLTIPISENYFSCFQRSQPEEKFLLLQVFLPSHISYFYLNELTFQSTDKNFWLNRRLSVHVFSSCVHNKQNTCFMTDGINTLSSYPFQAILTKKKIANVTHKLSSQISQVHALHVQWGFCRSWSWSPPCHMGKIHCENTMLSPLPHRHVRAGLSMW